MAEWRDFGATNESDTCLWCGNKLRYRSFPVGEWISTARVAAGEKQPTARAEKSGDYEDGFFCGLRCAYRFAETLAMHGRRLEPRTRRIVRRA